MGGGKGEDYCCVKLLRILVLYNPLYFTIQACNYKNKNKSAYLTFPVCMCAVSYTHLTLPTIVGV